MSTVRVRRLVSELKNQSVEYKASRLEEELSVLGPDTERMRENALLVTALREAGIWPPLTKR